MDPTNNGGAMQTKSTPSSTTHCTTPGQCVPMSAIQAMHNRHKCSMLVWAARGWEEEFYRARGMAQALQHLIHRFDGAAWAASNDVLMGGYHPLGGFEAAWAALPVGFETSSLAQVKEILVATGTKWPSYDITDTQLDAVVQLKDGKVAAINADDEHDPLGAELNDGALLHGSPCVVSAIVAQGGAA